MKTLIFCFIISILVHTALFIDYSSKKSNKNSSLIAKKNFIDVEIIQASDGVLNAEDKSGIDKISNTVLNNIEKKVIKNINSIDKSINPNKQKSVLKTAKKGVDGYQNTKTFSAGYASYMPQPKYPLISRRNKEEGSIFFNIELDENGKLITYSIIKSSGYKRLDKEAEKALKAAKFQPALKNGIPVKSDFDLTITFTLKGKQVNNEYN